MGLRRNSCSRLPDDQGHAEPSAAADRGRITPLQSVKSFQRPRLLSGVFGEERWIGLRFFTMAWWCGVQTGDSGDPSSAYTAHLVALRDRLPPDLLATEESVSLHDTRLRELRFLAAEKSLSLGLDSYGGEERLTLFYSGVERFESLADPKVDLGGPAGYGDLGYCEVAMLPSGGARSIDCYSPAASSWPWCSGVSGFDESKTPNQPLQQTGAAVRPSGVLNPPRGPGC